MSSTPGKNDDKKSGGNEEESKVDMKVLKNNVQFLEERISLVGGGLGPVDDDLSEDQSDEEAGKLRYVRDGIGNGGEGEFFSSRDVLDGEEKGEFRELHERVRLMEENHKELMEEQVNVRKLLERNLHTSFADRQSMTRSMATLGASVAPAMGPDGLPMQVMTRVASSLQMGGGGGSTLESDTFSLMMISKVKSQSWVLGVSSFSFQMILVTMIAIDQIKLSANSTQFDVPFQVSFVVTVGQFLSIILCLGTQNDVLVAIRSFFSLGNVSNWDQVIGEDGNRTWNLWLVRIALPNLMKLLQGILVTFVSFVIIIQADDIIDLLKDFTALMVISEVDNILFSLASHGYLGNQLAKETETVEDTKITSNNDNFLSSNRQKSSGLLFARLVFLFMLCGMIAWWGTILTKQRNGVYFIAKFPDCEDHVHLGLDKFGDEECFGGPLNSLECQFENGDCLDFNTAYPLCRQDELVNVGAEVGNGICNITFATYECDYDGGDCCPASITRSVNFENNECNGGFISTENCGYDGGDCNDFVREFPDCPLDEIAEIAGSSEIVLGNGICEGMAYANEKCGLEFRDCDVGQLGQDVIFRGASSGSALEYHSIMSDDGSKLMLGLFKTDVDDTYNGDSAGKVKLFGYDSEVRLWSSSGDDLVGDEDKGDAYFGFGIAMSVDGGRIAVGVPLYNQKRGKVQVYGFDASLNGWVQVGQDIIDPFREYVARFGYTIDMSHDGTRIAIGSMTAKPLNDNDGANGGAVQMYELETSGQNWERMGNDIVGSNRELISYFYVRLNASGTRVYFSSGYFDKATVSLKSYEFKNGEWTQLGTEIQTPYIQSYARPSISADGSRIAVSSYTRLDADLPGRVSIYDLDTNGTVPEWKEVGFPIKSEKKENSGTKTDGFGYSISMNADGSLLAVGTLDPECLGGTKWCPTGSVRFYRYDAKNPPHRIFSRVPWKRDSDFANVMQVEDREVDGNVFGWDLSLSGDGSKISVSGYDFNKAYSFVKVYEVDDLFYPDCMVHEPEKIGDGFCRQNEPYYTKQCAYDGGDCPAPKTVKGYENCYVRIPDKIGDSTCDDYFPYNSEQCGYDGGDCGAPMQSEDYPECYVRNPTRLGDGKCDSHVPYISMECGWDGGDCNP